MRWHGKHDVSRLISRVAMCVGYPSHSYHPQGVYTGAKSPGDGGGGAVGRVGWARWDNLEWWGGGVLAQGLGG